MVFAEARRAFHQHVAAREQRNQHTVHDLPVPTMALESRRELLASFRQEIQPVARAGCRLLSFHSY